MGKHKSSSAPTVVQQEPAPPVVTPAVARSIAQDAQAAQINQENARQRLYGISSLYNRLGSSAGGNQTLGGN